MQNKNIQINANSLNQEIYKKKVDFLDQNLSIIKQLPIFDGNPKEWARFIASFERSTDLCGFSNDENLERLRQSRGSWE